MNNVDIIKILSPLLLFVFHLFYLVVVSKDPFLNKWIDGSFSFFLSLVLCNIVRARVVASRESAQQPEDDPQDPEQS